jgi:hypothetical protein
MLANSYPGDGEYTFTPENQSHVIVTFSGDMAF